MRLLELFDKTADYKITRQDTLVHTSAIFEAEFWVGEGLKKRRYEVRMFLSPPDVVADESGNQSMYEFIKDNIDESETIMDVSFSAEQPSHHRHSDMVDHITGMGNQFEVMSTVIEITKYAVNRYKPKWIVFVALEQSRAKLYRHIAKRMGPKVYEFTGNANYFLIKL